MRSRELQLDISGEEARALHRIVRGMHDGHCAKCGHLGPAESFVVDFVLREGHECPECGFIVTTEEASAALAAFQPHLQKSLDIFERWRQGNANNTASPNG